MPRRVVQRPAPPLLITNLWFPTPFRTKDQHLRDLLGHINPQSYPVYDNNRMLLKYMLSPGLCRTFAQTGSCFLCVRTWNNLSHINIVVTNCPTGFAAVLIFGNNAKVNGRSRQENIGLWCSSCHFSDVCTFPVKTLISPCKDAPFKKTKSVEIDTRSSREKPKIHSIYGRTFLLSPNKGAPHPTLI